MIKTTFCFWHIINFTVISIIGFCDCAIAQKGYKKSELTFVDLENHNLDSINPYYFFGELSEFENFRVNNNAFFNNAVKLKGGITFNNRQFKNIYFAYNIQKDIVIAHKQDKTGKILYIDLPSEFVERFDFTIDGYNFNFINNKNKNVVHPNLEEGIYEEVYCKKLKLYIKHNKQLHFSQNGQSEYIPNKQTFLINDNQLFKIDRNKNLYKAFPNHKKEISRYLRDKKINMKKANQQQIKPLIQYIEGL